MCISRDFCDTDVFSVFSCPIHYGVSSCNEILLLVGKQRLIAKLLKLSNHCDQGIIGCCHTEVNVILVHLPILSNDALSHFCFTSNFRNNSKCPVFYNTVAYIYGRTLIMYFPRHIFVKEKGLGGVVSSILASYL